MSLNNIKNNVNDHNKKPNNEEKDFSLYDALESMHKKVDILFELVEDIKQNKKREKKNFWEFFKKKSS